MIDVVSIKFKNRGKCYYFSPNGLDVHSGDKVIVETAKGYEIADCVHGNHPVPECAVVQPLRAVQRIATRDDLRIAQLNVQREKDAFEICQQKILEHKLDMKLVDVECNFEGTKTLFFFTSNGRVDFRELVKDLASIFRNRIELRQIGVRDEAKLIGGIGICGRPYCCSQFMDDFQPVSTKMAKIQSLSLNPAKISGSCGRLMCCLRYEQDAYEDLLRKVPKQGAFVETKDGFGTAVQVNLLRQTVKVRLDQDNDDSLHLYKANELCAVPGGRPRDGEEPVSTFRYVPEPEPEEEEETNPWFIEPQYHDPALLEPTPIQAPPAAEEGGEVRKSRRRRRKNRAEARPDQPPAPKSEKPEPKREKPEPKRDKPEPKRDRPAQKKPNPEKKPRPGQKREAAERRANPDGGAKPESRPRAAAPKKQDAPPKAEGAKPGYRRHYRGKPKNRES